MSVTTNNPTVQTQALWTWSTPIEGQQQFPVSFPTANAATKSGLQPADLSAYMQIPLQRFSVPPQPIDPTEVTEWIRFAEDEIEARTNVRLCQTWIAAPAAKSATTVAVLNVSAKYNYQQPGIDFDVEEPPYDFYFERFRDEGWGYLHLRNRPVKSVSTFSAVADSSSNLTGTKNTAFVYPLLNEFFRMPLSWTVEDQNRGLLRYVPAVSVQMLPLFAMQLAFMGFAQSVPGGLWIQYNAGLTAADYVGEWSFMKRLVLAKTAQTAFAAMQTSVNMGVLEIQTQGDGLMQRRKYSEKGAFWPQIQEQKEQEKMLVRRALQKGGGFHIGML